MADFELEGFGVDHLHFSLELDMRYKTQLNQTRVVVPKVELTSEADVAELCDTFGTRYAAQYSPEAAFPQAGIDIEEFHLKVWVPADHPGLFAHPVRPGDGGQARTGDRDVYWGPGPGARSTPVYDRQKLVAGDRFEGPAIVEAPDTTTVVPPDWSFRVDEFDNGVLTRRQPQAHPEGDAS